MYITPEECPEFAAFITSSSLHMYTQWIEDGEYIVCPFSTIDRAYEAFKIGQDKGWYCDDVKNLYDVDYESHNPLNQTYDEDDIAYDAYPYYNDVMYDE